MKKDAAYGNGAASALCSRQSGSWDNSTQCLNSECVTLMCLWWLKGKRKVQGVPQSRAAAFPRHQEEEETDKTKQLQIEQMYESIKISSLFPKRGNRNAKRNENTQEQNNTRQIASQNKQ